LSCRPPPPSPLFPYTTLFRSRAPREQPPAEEPRAATRALLVRDGKTFVIDNPRAVVGRSRRSDLVVDDPNVSRKHAELQLRGSEDRKSTRLNSSHDQNSYAVF